MFTPILKALPSDYYTGEEKDTVIARAASWTNMGNIIFVLLAGYLASLSWRYTFAIYGIGFLVLVAIQLFLPVKTLKSETPKLADILSEIPDSSDIVGAAGSAVVQEEEKKQIQKVQDEHDENCIKETEPMPLFVYIVAVCMCLFTMSVYLLYTNYAIIIAERGVTDPTISGLAFATNSTVAFLISFSLPVVKKKLGGYIFAFIPFCLGLSYIIFYFAYNLPLMFLTQILCAMSMGTAIPTSAILILKRVCPDNAVKGMAFLTVAMFTGQFLSPIVFSYLPTLFGYSETTIQFILVAVICFILTAIISMNVKKFGTV